MGLVVKSCDTFSKGFVGLVKLARKLSAGLGGKMSLVVKKCDTSSKGFVTMSPFA